VGDATSEIMPERHHLFTQPDRCAGRAHFLKLDGLTRERAPLLVQVRKAVIFLSAAQSRRSEPGPFSLRHRGHPQPRSTNQLTAFLFSDRGIYRPGDTIHIGRSTKTADWSKT